METMTALSITGNVTFSLQGRHYLYERVSVSRRGVFKVCPYAGNLKFHPGDKLLIRIRVRVLGSEVVIKAPVIVETHNYGDGEFISFRFWNLEPQVRKHLYRALAQGNRVQIRRKRRYLFASNVAIDAGRKFFMDWQCCDISETGMLVYCDLTKKEGLKLDQAIEGQLYNNASYKISTFKGRVVRSMRMMLPGSGVFVEAYGIEFDHFNFEKIRNYLGKCLDR